jgi:hypothetical protein
MSRAFIMKIDSASTAIVHSQVVQAAILASNSYSLTQIPANQSVCSLAETNLI